MRVFTVLGILFYAGILILLGAGLVIFSLNLLQPIEISALVEYAQSNINSRVIVGLSGFLLIVISFSFAQIILGRLQREKTIAFTTPSGEVTVALTAVEDLIKHLIFVIPEIKELRPDVIASKKGIIVNLRVILRSEANIPDLSARLQEITKTKIQEVLGLEEDIVIKIHIVKFSREDKDKKKKDVEKNEPTIPFVGYKL